MRCVGKHCLSLHPLHLSLNKLTETSLVQQWKLTWNFTTPRLTITIMSSFAGICSLVHQFGQVIKDYQMFCNLLNISKANFYFLLLQRIHQKKVFFFLLHCYKNWTSLKNVENFLGYSAWSRVQKLYVWMEDFFFLTMEKIFF